MIKRSIFVAVFFCLLTGAQLKGDKKIDIVSQDFEVFLESFVDKTDHALFVSYYNKFSAVLSESSQKDESYKRLFATALAHLKLEDIELFNVIDSWIQERDEERMADTQRFLMRFGAHKEFLEAKRAMVRKEQLPEFVEGSFDAFLNLVVSPEDHDVFILYYTKLMDETGRADDEKRLATQNYLVKRAADSLKADRPEWFADLSPHLGRAALEKPDGRAEKIFRFLQRYGVHQEFLEVQALAATKDVPVDSFFAQVGSFVSGLGSTVAGWFGFGTTKTT